MWQRISYERRLLSYLIIGGLLPVLTASVGLLYFLHIVLQDNMRERALNDIYTVMQDTDQLIGRYTQIISALDMETDLHELLTGHSQNTQAIYSKMFLLTHEHRDDIALHILSADGEIQLSTRFLPQEYLLPQNKNWGILRSASGSYGTVFLSSDKSVEENRNRIFALAKAIRNDGQIVGYVIIDVYRLALLRIVQERLGSASQDFLLLDRNHYIMLNTAFGGDEGFPRKLFYYLKGSKGMVELPSKDRLSYQQSSEYGFYIIRTVHIDNSIFFLVMRIVIAVDIFAVILIVLLSTRLSRNLWRPLGELMAAMRRIRDNDFSVHIATERQDEIGELNYTFNKMVEHIKALLNNVREKQKSLRIAQVKQLQSRVKPHFIYNTLSLIKWSAKLGDMEGTADLAVQLGKLLRMSISSREFISVREEIDLLQAYLTIQQRRFNDRLTTELDIPLAIENYIIPQLILQPLVENALIHGLEDMKNGGIFYLAGRLDDAGYLEFIVHDNGKGISQEKIKDVLLAQENHYGLFNVHMRAILYGDDSCGITIDSVEGQYTTITLKLKAVKEAPEF